jgi:hypothetical protein
MRRTTTVGAALLALLLGAGCGDDSSPVRPSVPVPNVAGTYWAQWQVQFERSRDGFSGSYFCWGQLTISQSGAASGQASLGGFSVVSGGCPQATFDLTGTIQADGTVRITTGGPRPNEGQCPVAPAASYEGVWANTNLSARATATINCPGPGEGQHRFDYIVTASRNQ